MNSPTSSGDAAERSSESTANGCFVCGPANPIGLQVRFHMDGDICRGAFTPETRHAGYNKVMHGGLLFALLDDVMANWLWLQGQACFTARADVRYREPLIIGTPVLLEGRCERRRGRLAEMQGRIVRAADDVLVAQASARFMLRDDMVGAEPQVPGETS
ncbi:MAG: PaaI family thioesterase [Pseudomonadales bacterium]